MLQIFEDGRLTDGKGRVISFHNVLIIMTSNLPIYSSGFRQDHLEESSYRDQLKEHMRPEFINRIDSIVVFKQLNMVHYEKIIVNLEAELNTRISEKDFRIQIGNGLRDYLIKAGTSTQSGGRGIRRVFQSFVVDAVSDRIISAPYLAKGPWILEYEKEQGVFWQDGIWNQIYLPPASTSN